MKLVESWEIFLSSHPDVQKICSKLDSLQNLLVSNKIDDNFKLLESSPSTILLSYDSIQDSIIPSFHHMSIGNGIIDNEFLMVGLTGFSKSATPVILNSNSFSSFKSDKAPPPIWNDLINDKEDAAGDGKGKVEFKRFSILPPPLFEIILHDDLSPTALLDRAISVLVRDQDKISNFLSDIIKQRLIDSTIGDDPSDDELKEASSEKAISDLFQKCFYDFLLFLWSTSNPNLQDKFVQTISPVVNKPFISDRVGKIHEDHIDSPSAPTASHHDPSKIEDVIKSVVKSVFEAQSLSSSTRLPLADEEKSKPSKGMKAFTNLGERVANTILKISSDGISIPSIPSSGCVEILAAKSGPAVSNLLLHHFSNEDFNMAKGMAHFLGNGQVLSPDPSSISNVSPFFIHTRSASSMSTVEQADLFTLQIMNESNSLQKEDAKDLMKNDLFIATDFWQFSIQLKNHHLLWELYTGEESYLSKALESINDHIKKNQPTYIDYITNHPHFVVSFLQIIQFRMQSFFKSCIQAIDVDDIKFEFLNFNDLLNSIEMHSYQVVIPQWFKLELAKSSKTSSSKKRDLDSKDTTDLDTTTIPRKGKPVINDSVDPACSLSSNETYRFVFHKNNLSGLSIPKINGSDICLKYHIEGKCKSNCNRAKTHIKLDSHSLIELRQLVKSVREKYKAFKESRRNNRPSDSTTNAEGEQD